MVKRVDLRTVLVVETEPSFFAIIVEEVLRFMVQPVGQQRKDWLLMVTQEHQPLIDTVIRQFRESFIVH